MRLVKKVRWMRARLPQMIPRTQRQEMKFSILKKFLCIKNWWVKHWRLIVQACLIFISQKYSFHQNQLNYSYLVLKTELKKLKDNTLNVEKKFQMCQFAVTFRDLKYTKGTFIYNSVVICQQSFYSCQYSTISKYSELHFFLISCIITLKEITCHEFPWCVCIYIFI